MRTDTFDPREPNSAEQQQAESAALEAGQRLEDANNAQKERRAQEIHDENSGADLIGGKFKTQDDLLKAYQELQKKMGQGEETSSEEQTPEATQEEPTEEGTEPAEETPEVFVNAAAQYEESGELNAETIEELSKMDPKDLITQYMAFYSKSAQQQTQQALDAKAQENILSSVGGADAYAKMVAWAGDNLSQEEIDNYNLVTNSGNAAAINFAVESLSNRYKAAEGYEAPLVTGKRAANKNEVYRSQAELARDIADPRYKNDPAFRMDVEEKLAKSQNLL